MEERQDYHDNRTLVSGIKERVSKLERIVERQVSLKINKTLYEIAAAGLCKTSSDEECKKNGFLICGDEKLLKRKDRNKKEEYLIRQDGSEVTDYGGRAREISYFSNFGYEKILVVSKDSKNNQYLIAKDGTVVYGSPFECFSNNLTRRGDDFFVCGKKANGSYWAYYSRDGKEFKSDDELSICAEIMKDFVSIGQDNAFQETYHWLESILNDTPDKAKMEVMLSFRDTFASLLSRYRDSRDERDKEEIGKSLKALRSHVEKNLGKFMHGLGYKIE